MAMEDDLRYSYEPLLSGGGSGNDRLNGTNHQKTTFFISLAKWVLKFTMWVIFISWVSLFFVVPSEFGTALYDDWVDATSGTLFGQTGCVLLLYCGPILIIACLAVPYLIISGREENQENFQKKKAPRFRLWTFPALVDGPFGVVSAAEFIGIILFVVFVFWCVYVYTVENFKRLPSIGDLTPYEKRTFMLQMSAYCFGLISLSCLAFLFLPIARGSILLRLIDIPFEHATRYHVWLGNLTMFLASLHGLGYMLVWVMRGRILSEIIEWKNLGAANFAGVICYLFGLLIWVTTLPPLRKAYFEIFFYTHQLYIFFVIFLALHIGDTSFSQVAGGIFLFMLDRFLRFVQSRRTVNIASATCFPCGTVKLVFPKPRHLSYNALSFVFLQVKEVSFLQWHPFSVSSSALDGKYHLSVLVKAVGDWTTKLRGKVSHISEEEHQTVLSGPPHSQIIASLEGPYGHESPYFLMYEKLVLVAGGSGISPFLAILSDILHRINNKPRLPSGVSLIWAVRRSNELSVLSTLDLGSICPFFNDRLDIKIQIYVTRESHPSPEQDNINHNVTCSSALNISNGRIVSMLVGTGNKIWAGSYVIVSTVGFVITLALLDIWYINPFGITYWWYRGLLFLGCMVVSVIIFGGLVISLWLLWERTLSGEECEAIGERIGIMQNNGVETDKNLRQTALANAITIHYGFRPDFKEIFESISERMDEADVGVIVCGPATLQTSVAKECRSRNLRRRGSSNQPIFHYNSHSFDL